MRTCKALLAAGAILLALLASMWAEDSLPADAVVTPPPAPSETGKERLSDKASDEQRVDNCKVPPERQGTKERPNDCPQANRAVPTK